MSQGSGREDPERQARRERLMSYPGIFSGMTEEQIRAYHQDAAEAEIPCIRCKRVILAGCRDPLCGHPVAGEVAGS